ncbi:hypothetical protein GGR22_002417 [Flavobacterium gossypii]|uniref:Uncharacterized protein n=1 Tax=Flavobacterium gossypii TaxID=1646119 RepID=A0ABR6DRD2_9FLAO|nr:hypothetical protein [Flavobacterium gossypii]
MSALSFDNQMLMKYIAIGGEGAIKFVFPDSKDFIFGGVFFPDLFHLLKILEMLFIIDLG